MAADITVYYETQSEISIELGSYTKTPTVVESGNNYTKLDNGTLQCFDTVSVQVQTSVTINTNTITFPKAFTSIPEVTAQPQDSYTTDFSITNITTTDFTINYKNNRSSTISVKYNANGTWQ